MLNLTSRIHDLLILGAGPTALAALAGLPCGVAVAVATGASSASVRHHGGLPAKIRAVAYETREGVGLRDPITFASGEAGGLYTTAAVGGLGNYWGQQFVRYSERDPWPRSVFSEYSDYLKCCHDIERLFSFAPHNDPPLSAPIEGDYRALVPRLLVGEARRQPTHLTAIRQAFDRLARDHNAFVTQSTAVRWELRRDHVSVLLADGSKLRGKQLLLSAGVVGSLRLAMASCNQITAVSLQDHAPVMALTAGLGLNLPLLLHGSRHFNSLTIERREADHVLLFASVYTMSRAPLGLSLTALGLPPLGRGFLAPRLVDFIRPVQIWTTKSYARYQIDRGAPTARLTARSHASEDAELNSFVFWLKSKAQVLRLSTTPAGEGFHYHDGKVSEDGDTFEPLPSFLHRNFEGRIVCIDASSLTEIGCRPHTLTAMAAAYQQAKSTVERGCLE